MDERQRYLFEVMGVLIVPNVVTPEELRELRAVLDAHEAAEQPLRPRHRPIGGLSIGNGLSSFPRWRTGDSDDSWEHCPQHLTDENNMLHWSPAYRNLLTNPVLTPILEELLTEGYRLDHIYGFILSGGAPGGGFHTVGGIKGGGMYQ